MTNNTVNPYNSPNTLIITDKDQNQVIVTQPVTSIIEITAPGTQGPNISPETSILIISESSPSNSTVIQPDVKTITISATGVQGPAGPSPDTSSLVSITTFNAFTSSYTTGSFTGSFIGDGSQLTGIVSSKWTGSNPISRESNVEVTGSFSVTGGITGSLFGTASFANTASFVNPLIQSVRLTGSLFISASFSTSSAALSAYKSGSTVLDIQGSQGQLFSVVDSLTGSLMSVNDVSGLPILEVFSDDRIVMGTYGNPAMVITGSVVNVTGSLNVSGTASATSFVGDGSQLTNLPIPFISAFAGM